MKVAILVRVSSKSDRQDYDRQVSDLTALAEKNKWGIVKVITANVSATKTACHSGRTSPNSTDW